MKALNAIMSLVVDEFGVTKEEISSFDGRQPIADARHAFILTAFRVGFNHHQTADYINCCLSIVEKGIKVAKNKRDTESAFRLKVDKIKELL